MKIIPNPELIDEENPEWTDERIANSIGFSELPESLQKKLLGGRPKSAVTKQRITIRLSRHVVDQFRASGNGWQTRIDTALQDWLKTHPAA